MMLGPRRRWRLWLRDLAALSAFSSVALSGVLPTVVLVTFLVALGLSMAGKRPLADQRTASVLTLLAIAVGLFGASFLGVLDLVVAAVSFATLVTAHRMLSEPTLQATRQVLLASTLLVSGGAALSGELWFAGALCGFFVAGSWCLALAVLEGADEVDQDVELAPAVRQVGLGTVATIGLGIAFFVFFPRLSWNLANRRASAGLTGGVTGMSDTVKLGGGGGIKTSPRIVLRARLQPDPRADRLNAYWVGRHFTDFNGTEWTSPTTASPTTASVSLFRLARGRSFVQQDIELTPAYASRTLVALETPSSFSNARALTPNGSAPMALVEVVGDQVSAAIAAPASTYSATSAIDEPLDERTPSTVATALPSLDPRIQALSDELARGGTNARGKALRLERELKRRYGYTLDLPGDVSDPLADFLFQRKAGHCEDFATALAVMLRLQGIPSRVTTGFFGGTRSGERYTVRAGDAHAWVEAYVDGRWTRYDATPESGRLGAPPEFLSWLATTYEAVEEWWRVRVMDYSIRDQIGFARNLVAPPRAPQADPTPSDAPASSRSTWPRWAMGLLVLALAAAAALSFRARSEPHPATDFLREIERRLERAGVAQATTLPLEELSSQLVASGHPLGPALAEACRGYLAARFGAQALPVEERARLLALLETPPARG